MNLKIKLPIKILYIILSVSFGCPLLSETKEWTEVRKKNDVSVYTRPFPDSKINEFLGKTEVSANLAQVFSILSDINSCEYLYHNCKKIEVISKTDRSSVLYIRNGAPWPVSDRDIVIERNADQNQRTKVASIKIRKSESVSRPSPSGVTRIDKFEATWRMTPLPNGVVKIEYQGHLEPGGSLPDSAVNAANPDTPYHTLLNMRKAIDDGRLKEAKIPWIKEFDAN